ncbi:Tim44-like domain-containing protein [Pseudodesulfovibrio indicus]|uniref:Tim44-like domain-containing protein n=1 Tax=Pseudodesulfovibrio indicus TaxID=1716143 RepID=UPI002930279D|nr:Tim44-like domain-containing protein [Pseudodesulfovibrio indicus]
MHNVITRSTGLAGRVSRCLASASLILLTATPALAQEGTPSRSGSVLNILLLGVVAYFLVRAYRRRSGHGNDRQDRPKRPDIEPRDLRGTGGDAPPSDTPAQKPVDRHEAARRTWDMLSSQPADPARPADRPQPTTPTGPPSARADGFDEAEFLEGAKLFFSRYQQSVGEEEFRDIRDFMSDEVYAEAVAGHRERAEVMLVTARLMELKQEDGQTVASVYYDAQLRVGDGGRPDNLRTVWDFARDDSVPDGLWVLEKINSIDQ